MNNGKICVSVCAETADELIEQIKRAEVLADVIEIRFDCLDEEKFCYFSAEQLEPFFKKLTKLQLKKLLLATNRPKDQGGLNLHLASEDFHRREAFFHNARKFYEFGMVDGEYDFPICKAYFKNSVQIISFHDFQGIVNNLEEIYKKMSQESEVVKLAVKTDDITDTIAVWKLLERAKAEKKQIIPIAMGEAGKWTRILGLAHGAFMTYAALDAGRETAPGQVSAKDLIEVYRVKELNEETEVYGILGSNTSVSMSPYIHNAAFEFHNLNAVFVPLQVNDLDEFIRRMVKPETREVELNFKGFAVTIPHKQTIIKHLDSIDETAKKIGAVNTVKIIDGKLHGYNTDAKGFIEPLLNSYGDLCNAKVAVLGAGGAARACIYALQKEGAKITIFARDLQKANDLADDFQVEFKALGTQHSALGTFGDFDILVNTTPLGMKGKAEGETPAAAEQLKGLHLVYDLIYTPFQTRLMKEADRAEVPKIGGLAMLIAQAMEQQKIWTGKDAPMKEMSRAVLKRLQ